VRSIVGTGIPACRSLRWIFAHSWARGGPVGPQLTLCQFFDFPFRVDASSFFRSFVAQPAPPIERALFCRPSSPAVIVQWLATAPVLRLTPPPSWIAIGRFVAPSLECKRPTGRSIAAGSVGRGIVRLGSQRYRAVQRDCLPCPALSTLCSSIPLLPLWAQARLQRTKPRAKLSQQLASARACMLDELLPTKRPVSGPANCRGSRTRTFAESRIAASQKPCLPVQ
jgi:hypothetical protein